MINLDRKLEEGDDVMLKKIHGAETNYYDGKVTKMTGRTTHVEMGHADRTIIFSNSTGKQWGGNAIVTWKLTR